MCPYGYAPRGEHAHAQVWAPADATSRWSSISSMSIEGCQSNYLINTSDESVNASTFLFVLEHDIMPLTTPFPGARSVLIMDTCRILIRNMQFMHYVHDFMYIAFSFLLIRQILVQ